MKTAFPRGAWEREKEQIDCLVDVAKQGHLDLAIVGSEVLLRGDLKESELITYIGQVKQRLAEDPSVPIPVTTADVYGELLSHPTVLSAVDVVFANSRRSSWPHGRNRAWTCA